MPAQEPVETIISRSNTVRCSSRWASSSLPWAVSSARRWSSSIRMLWAACIRVGFGVT